MTSPTPYHDDDLEASFSPPSEHEPDNFPGRSSLDSVSTTSLVLERIHPSGRDNVLYDDPEAAVADKEVVLSDDEDDYISDIERGRDALLKPMEKKMRRAMYIVAGVLIGGWVLALIVYLSKESVRLHDASHEAGAAKPGMGTEPLTMDGVHGGEWLASKRGIRWISDGQKDGLMLVPGRGTSDQGYLEIHDVRNDSDRHVLMRKKTIRYDRKTIQVQKYWPSPDLKHVLLASDVKNHWRYSFFAKYWLLNVDTQKAEPLVPGKPDQKLALAIWAPTSDAVAFVVDNDVEIRQLSGKKATIKVTTNGSKDLFNGIPDWVYEEEVFANNKALWWSEDGQHLAFLQTNETNVPEYPLQYFASRPSGESPSEGLENYPELDFIKYPKAGAPNPVVKLKFFDLGKKEVFSVDIENGSAEDDRLITEVIWAGDEQVLIRETNRESDVLKMILINVKRRSGRVVRELDVFKLDGGWFEVAHHTTYIPADPRKNRKYPGYLDTVIHEGYDHLAYFSPLDATKPTLLTKGKWEVVEAPSGVDLDNNIVYFGSTERSPIERHIYSVKLDGSDKRPVTNTSTDGLYDVSFSKHGGYALLSYEGPGVPWQKVMGTPAVDGDFHKVLETNEYLKEMVSKYALPENIFSTVTIDGFELQVVERRPANFDPSKKYPVLFYVYGGPVSQTVTKAFHVDFQAYVASALEYIVVTVDGRGTGFIGRKARCIIRDNIGYWESRDQIETAKMWAAKDYIDKSRIAIWGWSYGGFTTLKTLERDAGKTFSYGMAVAPVTDWRFYDSIYTERYMHMPQHNPEGYDNSTITDMAALSNNVRFLVMHGVADDNVHFQNSLTLLDRLDLNGVENYDFHAFPDSDHSIFFHNANRMVYDRLRQWLIRAFNGEYLNLSDIEPNDEDQNRTVVNL